MKKVCILGASGSVGDSTLRLIRKFPENFKLTAISVHSNWKKAEEIILEFQPELVCISNPNSEARSLGRSCRNTHILYGMEGLDEIASSDSVDIVVTAIVGSVGVRPTVAAIQANKDIAIANKETLVTFGPYINSILKNSGSRMIPVDSEHNALFQLLERKPRNSVKNLILTASGGAFRDYPLERLKDVTVSQALMHPTWSMGPKITVDSAGLINKGLEVIEAHFLFGFDYENIEVVIHPQSIVHGMIESLDGSITAYASYPDMIFPIAHALFYPDSVPDILVESKPASWKNLEFRSPDLKRYPGLELSYKAGKIGGTATAIFNASNEMACRLFLQEKISFTDIPEIIALTLDSLPVEYPSDLEGFIQADQSAREFVAVKYNRGAIVC